MRKIALIFFLTFGVLFSLVFIRFFFTGKTATFQEIFQFVTQDFLPRSNISLHINALSGIPSTFFDYSHYDFGIFNPLVYPFGAILGFFGYIGGFLTLLLTFIQEAVTAVANLLVFVFVG